jgi:hypothetical protein
LTQSLVVTFDPKPTCFVWGRSDAQMRVDATSIGSD